MQQADSFINGPRPPPDAALDEADGPPPAFVPDHQLLRRIGRGSYGEVWLARSSLGTYRAVKVVYRNSFKDQRPFEREWSGIRKYEPVSRSHEGLVQVLHVGINEQHGCFYYVMEVADDRDAGQSIQPPTYVPRTLAEDLARRRRVSAHECLKLGLGLTRALAQLHQHGLVHRDIKPSNIIFINGTPKLADIGLVAETSEARSYVGTEGFIAPEGPGSRQADVYSLGKVLYEASTGKDRQEFPKLPTGFEAMPDQAEFLELNEIVTRACRHDPRDRYQTAQQMHDELLLLANGRSVRRLHLLERRLSVLKRVGGMVLLVLLLGGALGYQVYREQRARRDVRLRQVGAMLANGTQALKDGDLLGALPSFAEALRLDRTPAASRLSTPIGRVVGPMPQADWLLVGASALQVCRIQPRWRSDCHSTIQGPGEHP